jgi:hypothetical protein
VSEWKPTRASCAWVRDLAENLRILLIFSGIFGMAVVRYEQMFGLMYEMKLGREALDAQTAAWLETVAEFDSSEEWRGEGYCSAAAAPADVCRMDKGVASVTVKLARKLEKLPLVADAFAQGAISERHASVIATAATPERMAEFTNLEP